MLSIGGRNPASVEVGSLSHYLESRVFYHPRWCRIFSINSIMKHTRIAETDRYIRRRK